MQESTTINVAVPLTGLKRFRKWLAELISSNKSSFVCDDPLPTDEQLFAASDSDNEKLTGGSSATRVTRKLAAEQPTLRHGSLDGVSFDDESAADSLLSPDPSEALASTAVNATLLSPVFAKIAAFFLWIGAAWKKFKDSLPKADSRLFANQAYVYAPNAPRYAEPTKVSPRG